LTPETERPEITGWQRKLVLFLDRQIYRLSRRWLAVFNFFLGLYVLLPVLAPTLMVSGFPVAGRLLYLLYRPLCHQLPERSFFLFGPRIAYTLDELWAAGVLSPTDDLVARQAFIGTPGVGFKLGFCQRDIALYGGLFLGGLLFGLVRRRLRPLSFLGYVLSLLPMAIDGGLQLLTSYESTPLLRVLTGGLVGISSVWLLYPNLETAFAEIRLQANKRVHLE
jgi:uncharacterized membrane protein